MPKSARDLALIVAEFHTHCHRALELRDTTLLKVFEKTDAFRRPERFEQFLLSCEADARGRTGLENQPYEQADYLRRAFAAAAGINAGAIASEASGANIPTAIRKARLAALQQFKESAQP